MSEWAESGVVFDCAGEALVGILHRGGRRRGVLIVVGGPQYRAGSHRQFTLLARRLAADGVPVLRFDCRGLGDSSGVRAGFEHIADDLDAAVRAFQMQADGVDEIVIIGLCDAASAALLHPDLPAAVTGLVLLNPWVTEAEVPAETMLRHYYLRRLFSAAFWRKVLGGGVRGGTSLRELGGSVRAAVSARLARRSDAPSTAADASLAARMRQGLERFAGPVLLITSGNDLTASEFLDATRCDAHWQRLLAAERVSHEHLADANHTFSSQAWRTRVEDLVVGWLDRW